MAETNDLGTIELSGYNTIILPGGTYREWGSSDIQKIKNRIQEGGTIIARKRGVFWECVPVSIIKTRMSPRCKILFYKDENQPRNYC